MPKQKITREWIIEAAFQLAQSRGFEAVNARSVAQSAGCSVQPIYSCYQNMEQLMEDLFEYSRRYQIEYVRKRLDPNNYFGSAGRCHIFFAQEEKNLFRFLFLSKYVKGTTLEDIYQQYEIQEVTESIEQTLSLGPESAKRLYLNMMIYTHGIAAMAATDAMPVNFKEIHDNVNHAYHAFLNQIKEEEK